MANLSNWSPDELQAAAAAHALGVAEPAEAAILEGLVQSGDEDAVHAVHSFAETAARLAFAAPAASPHAGLRTKLLQKIREPKKPRLLPGFEEALPGFHILRSGQGSWRPTKYAGVDSMLLARDPESDIIATLLRLAPGAVYPGHRHAKEEQCWILEGDYKHTSGGVSATAAAGDFIRALAGSSHSITTEKGCVLLLTVSLKDEVLE